MCPLKDIEIKESKDPWITNKILELINGKNDLLAEAKKNQDPKIWDIARNMRNFVASLVKEAKRDLFSNEIENNHDPAKLWKKIHSMFPDRPVHGKINLMNTATGVLIEEREIPDYANAFFTSVGSNIIQDTGFDIENRTYEGTNFPRIF